MNVIIQNIIIKSLISSIEFPIESYGKAFLSFSECDEGQLGTEVEI